jgi:hypothetical protein
MKFYRGLVDLISKPTIAKVITVALGIGSGIWIYSKCYGLKHGNHTLLGLIGSSVPLLLILSIMGDVSEVEKPEIINSSKENNLPMIIDNKPHRHNMYKEEKQVDSIIPEMVEFLECKETKDEVITRRKRIYYGGSYND